MHLCRLLIASASLAAFAAGAAVVYKWTDSDGVVHFSDQPGPGSEKIVTSGAASNGVNAGGASHGTLPRQQAAQNGEITAVSIESPAKEQVFFNDDVVPLRLHVEPGLMPGQTVTWTLNGKTLTDPGQQGLSVALQELARGTYVVGASVTDGMTGALQSADSVTFYVRQPSELATQHKKT
jgi:hypothetical protein